VPQIEVTFDIDANGILAVHAKDKASAKEQSIRIEGSGGLSKAEIDRMISEAEAHAGEDRQRREVIEKRNALDSLIYQAGKTLSENADKVSADDKQKVEATLEEARSSLESDDVAVLDAARQKIEQAMHSVAEALYKAQSAGDPGAQGAPSSGGDSKRGGDDVVDAEYTEEKPN
ncbi:MAG: molecular chaperone DnaK, partial [Candidatus Eisenbacteria bacterium]